MNNTNDIQDIAHIVAGYEVWRRTQVQILESSDYHLSTSHYLDELARQRALDVLEEIRDLVNDFDLPLDEMFTRVRGLLGVQQ